MQEIRTLGRLSELRHDVKERRFYAQILQLAIQAALDSAGGTDGTVLAHRV